MQKQNIEVYMIYFDNVTKVYTNGCLALDDVSFNIVEGEFVSIIGRSGAGKSTIVKLILRQEHPTSGNVFFGNKNIANIPSNKLPNYRRQIGVVYQDFKLLDKKTVFENVAFALQVLGRSPQYVARYVPDVLQIVGLQEKAGCFPQELSGGEKQRVSLARAIISKPKIILADEPTGNLDYENSLEIAKLLLKINEMGTSVVLVTHQKELVNNFKKRVITLDKGRLVRDAQVGSYYLSPIVKKIKKSEEKEE